MGRRSIAQESALVTVQGTITLIDDNGLGQRWPGEARPAGIGDA
ncbi:MAG TPA: hypothetical protein VIY90_13810 [Steroidobacteraceae bacterium]